MQEAQRSTDALVDPAQLFAALALFAAGPAFADDPMTNLRVEVTNDIGKPVDRAGVVVRFIKGRSVTKLGKKVITVAPLPGLPLATAGSLPAAVASGGACAPPECPHLPRIFVLPTACPRPWSRTSSPR